MEEGEAALIVSSDSGPSSSSIRREVVGSHGCCPFLESRRGAVKSEEEGRQGVALRGTGGEACDLPDGAVQNLFPFGTGGRKRCTSLGIGDCGEGEVAAPGGKEEVERVPPPPRVLIRGADTDERIGEGSSAAVVDGVVTAVVEEKRLSKEVPMTTPMAGKRSISC
ncbi:hypothetical protein PIB30_085574 [Stylosanthes scabra]|uniref:Uncharacterized protein n=1 Tax=Stylosanthes scabra TaxID=79078 RepID=A0ABU6WUM3_9FABA|nr:hypothetical protein [Stylosanthes scabra]